MKKYVLPVIVRVFQIERIEGYATFPIRHNSNPAPTPGGMRLVYSKDSSDAPVCVESSFISQIKPYQQGMYVEYPDGHAVFWEKKAFLKAVGAENFNGSMAFPAAFTLARGGAKIYSRGWEMKDVYLVVSPASKRGEHPAPETLMMVWVKTGARMPWVPSQSDLFRNDWAIYEDTKNDD